MATATDASFARRFDEFGLHVDTDVLHRILEGERLPLELRHGSSVREYLVIPPLAQQSVRSSAMAAQHESGLPVLILAERIGERTAESYRATGLSYLDSDGNAWMRFGGVSIDIRGRKATSTPPRPSVVDANVFSARRAQAIFALLVWPELLQRPMTAVAAAAGVSVGQVHSTFRLLSAAGYLHESRRRIEHRVELIDHWAAAYRTGLSPTLAVRSFHDESYRPRLRDDENAVYVSGESALPDQLRSTTLTVYVDDFDPSLALEHRWRSNGEPNVFVRHRFWTPPSEEQTAPRESYGLRAAPWLLVYADLLASGDARQREIALELKDRDDRFHQG